MFNAVLISLLNDNYRKIYILLNNSNYMEYKEMFKENAGKFWRDLTRSPPKMTSNQILKNVGRSLLNYALISSVALGIMYVNKPQLKMPYLPEEGIHQRIESDISSEIPLTFHTQSEREDKLDVMAVYVYDFMNTWNPDFAENMLNPWIENVRDFHNKKSLEKSLGAKKVIVMGRDNICLNMVNKAGDILEKVKNYRGQPLDYLYINAHGNHSGLSSKYPKESSATLTSLIKKYSRDDFAHIMKPNGKVILIACDALEGYKQNLTIGEFVSYLFQRPTLASETPVFLETEIHSRDSVTRSPAGNNPSETKANLYGKWKLILPENDGEMRAEVRNRKFIDRLGELANSAVEKFSNFIVR